MVISNAKSAIQFLKAKVNSQFLQRAQKHDEGIRLHTEAYDGERRQEHIDYLNWVEKKIKLPKDSYEFFDSVFTLPVPTVDVTERAFEELFKVFDSDNGYVRVHTSKGAEKRARELEEALAVRKRMQGEGWRHFKSLPSSLIVCDMPRADSNTKNPYFYFLPIEKVTSLETEKDLQTGEERIGAVAFELDSITEGDKKIKRAAVFCDQFIYILQLRDDEWVPELETAHKTGYCPVSFLLSEPMTADDPIGRKSPVSACVRKLDWLLFLTTAQKIQDTYAPFPVYWRYRERCSFSDPKGNICVNGKLQNTMGETINECPNCKGRNSKGPGILAEIDPPIAGEHDLREPFGAVYPEVAPLEYLDKRIDTLENQVIRFMVGGSNEQQQKEAMNEDQIAAGFESKTITLFDIKKQLERAEQFILDTCLRMALGSGFTKSEVNYGTRFFLKSESYLLGTVEHGQKVGAPQAFITLHKEELMDSVNRHDPDQNQRARIMANLEPYPDQGVPAIMAMKAAGLISWQDYQIKVRFGEFIRRFEREQTQLQRWAIDTEKTLSQRIEEIKTILLTYIDNEPTTPPPTTAEGTGRA